MLVCRSCGVTNLIFLGDGGIARGEVVRGPGIVKELGGKEMKMRLA